MQQDQIAVVAQVLPVLLLAGMIEWPRVVRLREEYFDWAAERCSNMRSDSPIDPAVMIAEYERILAITERPEHRVAEKFRRNATLTFLSIFVGALPVVVVVAEATAIWALGTSDPSLLAEVVIAIGIASALLYAAAPILGRARVDKARITMSVRDFHKRMDGAGEGLREIVDEYHRAQADQANAKDDVGPGGT